MASQPHENTGNKPRDEASARAALRRYLFHEQVSTESVCVPHGIPPGIATDVIRQEIKPDSHVDFIRHACDTTRFYLLRDCVEYLGEFLSRSTQKLPDAFRSAESVDLLGDMGSPDQQKHAEQSWAKLTTHPKLADLAERLVRSFFHLGPGATPQPLEQNLAAQRNAHTKRQAETNQRDPSIATLERVLRPILPRGIDAKRQKDAILAAARPEARAYGLARVFLGLSDYSTLGRDWAGYRLVAEAEKSGRTVVAIALRQALNEFEKTDFGDDDPPLVDRARKDGLSRGYAGVLYFGGELTADERKFLDAEPGPRVNMFTPSLAN